MNIDFIQEIIEGTILLAEPSSWCNKYNVLPILPYIILIVSVTYQREVLSEMSGVFCSVAATWKDSSNGANVTVFHG